MGMIFPGMDPYLEDPQLWSGVHATFLVYLRDMLRPRLRPRYVAAVEERVFVEGPDRRITPDVAVRRQSVDERGGVALLEQSDTAPHVQLSSLEVHESYVAILDLRTNRRVVTVIEVVSPANKYAGSGRVSYETKQLEVLTSDTHLVEIDLLRYSPHVLAVPEWAARGRGPYDYLTCVNRAFGGRSRYELYPRRLPERLPRIAVPLADDDADVVLDVQAVWAQVYDAGDYRQRLDYDARCVPPLSPEDQAWANERIREARRDAAND